MTLADDLSTKTELKNLCAKPTNCYFYLDFLKPFEERFLGRK